MPALTSLKDAGARAVAAVEDWFFAPADPRAYAALRIGYAASTLCILVDLWPLRLSLFANSGMFGKTPSGVDPYGLLDVFTWSGSTAWVNAVFVVTALALVSLGLGIFQRASALVVYTWAASYCAAGAIAQSGFDTIARVIGFVLVVSPTPRTWTVLGTRKDEAPPIYGLRLVQWQVLLIYVCTVWLKAPDPFWRRGEAIPYFMMSIFARFPNPAFARLGALGAVLTYATLLIEVTLPFLLWMRKTRWLGVFLGVSMHIGIAVVAKLIPFTLAIVPLYFAFFERCDFDALASLVRRTEPR